MGLKILKGIKMWRNGTMVHPYTEERLNQDAEYEAALRKDEEREAVLREKEREAILREQEALREEEERPLTLDELRTARIAYYEPNVQCEALTLAGVRCKRSKQGSRFCKIHSKKQLKIASLV